MLEGQQAIVTGASRGIGKAIARELAEQGAMVVGTATSDKGAEAITQELQNYTGGGKGLVLDVASLESIEHFAEALKEQDIKASILVNNAGITRDNLMLRMNDVDWESVIDTNLNSVFRLSKLVMRNMIKARSGRIINITSVVGLSGNAGQANYAAAKAGIVGFTKSLAMELGGRGITVNAVAPGFIQTDMTDALNEEQKTALLGQIPLARLGQVEDIAKAVSFLCSDHSSYITGQTISVNGGMFMP